MVIIVINWNGKDVLPEMIRSVEAQIVGTGSRLIVFDNASTDESDVIVEREFGDRHWFSIIKSDSNLGFAAAANRAFKSVNDDIVILANNDTVFLPGSIKGLETFLIEHDNAGFAGPRLLWPDGTLQSSQRDFPFPMKLIREHIPFLKRKSAKYSLHDTEKKVDWLVGAVQAIRRSAFEQIGGFDEDFYFYHEETDFQKRLWNAGWEVWFTPSSEVIHSEGVSASKKYGNKLYYLRYIPAKLILLKKHSGSGSVIVFRIFMTLLQIGRMIIGYLHLSNSKDIRFSPYYCTEAIKLCWKNTELKGK